VSNPFTALVVGSGDMGSRHARHWRSAGAQLVGIVDPDRARAEAMATELNTTPFAELEAALALKPSVVSVCTPTFLHAPITLKALAGGAHVLCEKPIALTLADAQAMQAAAAASGRELRIGFMRRFDPAFEALRGAVASLGGPLLMQASISAGVRPKVLMHDAGANGGPIIDMACHLFDLWSHLTGAQPERIEAHGFTFARGKPEVARIANLALDSALVTLHYPGGTAGQVQISWGLPAGIAAREEHRYLGPEGLVEMAWPGSMHVHRGPTSESWTNPGGDPWELEIAQFYRELTVGAPQRVAGVEAGIDALRVSLAVLAASHRSVG
jgi:predicted dehydrogenase